MKKLKSLAYFNWKFQLGLAFLFASGIFLSGCNDNNSANPIAPTVTLSSESTSNIPGAVVSTKATVDAPGGGKLLTILVNGNASTIPAVSLNGATTKDVDISYTIPANAAIGSTIVISVQASDNSSQNSPVASFVVTVSDTPSKTIVQVTDDITTDTHWTSDKIYLLTKFIRVGSDLKGSGTTPVIDETKKATLTIDAGTVIYGKSGTPGGALIIQRGSKIVAIGTAEKPIVFTSDRAAGQRKGGDWAGVVICGQSANNIKGSTGTDGIAELEGNYGAFHGGNPAILDDNSGTLKYVRIEYAGYPINPNQELNGLTFGSVGSGTTIDYVQVTYANDDSYEWFGGTVNPHHLIAYKGIDDDFDTDNGFSGHVQFGLGIRDAGIADQSGSNGFEADNDGNGTANTPFTSAEFSNMTMIGPKATSNTTISLQFFNGAHLRRNLKQKIVNSFITAYPTGIFIDATQGANGTDAIINAQNGDLVLKNNLLAGVENWGGNGFGSASTTDEQTVSGIPFTVPKTAGAAPSGDFNHVSNPRGRMVAAGIGSDGKGGTSTTPFLNGVFTITDGQISSQNALPWFKVNNEVISKWSDSGISANVFEPLTAIPTLLPTASSKLLDQTKVSFEGFTDASFDKTVTYRGAFGSTDWTLGWVNWNPSTTDYSK
jgi:hypothetical protein